MKIQIVVGLIGAGIFLTACQTRVVEHGSRPGYGYNDNRSAGYANVQYRDRREGGSSDRSFVADDRSRTVASTNVNVHETNVNRTVVNKTNVNRTTVNQNNKKSPVNARATPPPQQRKKVEDKKKDNNQQQ